MNYPVLISSKNQQVWIIRYHPLPSIKNQVSSIKNRVSSMNYQVLIIEDQ